MPEWSKGAVCKTAGSAYGGSNPPPPITRVSTRAALLREWRPEPIRVRPPAVAAALVNGALALFLAALLLPGVEIAGIPGALVTAALIGALNLLLPPLIAALRLPFTVGLTFLLVLLLDAGLLMLVASIEPSVLTVDNFGWALSAALVTSALGLVLEVVTGTNDDLAYNIQVVRRVAKRTGAPVRPDVPGLLFLEIDGLALPVLRRAMRDGHAPQMARLLAQGSHRMIEWETDLSSQTGASQAGILLGSNRDIPAFRWVDKATGATVACSAPADCAAMEGRLSTGEGLLAGGGASRGNLFSGDADEVILTVSRLDAERRSNPGYRAFFANGFNVSRTVVLFTWEIVIEISAAIRAVRRDVRPRGHRGGMYPFLRAAMCVAVRDLVVFAVLTDMMRGRPVVYATFASYDEVAHHSGIERADTLEALRKLDQQIGRLERARRYAPRPYHLVILSDHGQTQGATFLQRNGYALEDLVRRAVDDAGVVGLATGDENDTAVGKAVREATGAAPKGGEGREAARLDARQVAVLASGNLGLIYLMDVPHRLSREEIDERHPRLLPTLRAHPHVAFAMVRTREGHALVLGADGERDLTTGAVDGVDPLAPFPPRAPGHLLRTDGFSNAPDILVNSFYDPELDEGCAFEELISFHGGLGGSQTRPFIMCPSDLPVPDEAIVGAEAVHRVLMGWRGTAGQRAPDAPPETGRP
jgi:uncharacterized membrane protein YvlD (DUF360 family)